MTAFEILTIVFYAVVVMIGYLICRGIATIFEGGNHAIFVNPKALGFVRYYLIPSKVPVILNWNIGSTVSDQVCENDVEHKQINTFKCLVNGEISLSWNTNNVLKLD